MKKETEGEGCVGGGRVGAVASVNVYMLRMGEWNVMLVRVFSDMACRTECVCSWFMRQSVCLCGVGNRLYVHVVCEQCVYACVHARKMEWGSECERG